LISVVFADPSRYFFPWSAPAFVRRSSGITATYFRPPIEAASGNLMRMDTRHIEKPAHSALVEYAPLSGILILAALMCFCIFLYTNEVKRSRAVLVQSARPEEIGKAGALSSPLAIPIAPALALSQPSTVAPAMTDRDGERNLALPDRKRTKSAGEGSRRFAKARDLRKSAANSYRILGSPMKATKRVKVLLIALWHRSKIIRKGYIQTAR
jgi:hypothetical protein